MNNFVKATVIVALLAMAACASDKTKNAGSEGTSGSSSSPYKGPNAGSAGSSVVGAPTETGQGAGGAVPTEATIHFPFDSSEIDQAGQQVVQAWGQYLNANPSLKVRLEGNCDERGTREYNVGLGERRANAVRQALTASGVSDRQLSVISYGEERPVANGHDEASWSQNRRVEIHAQ